MLRPLFILLLFYGCSVDESCELEDWLGTYSGTLQHFVNHKDGASEADTITISIGRFQDEIMIKGRKHERHYLTLQSPLCKASYGGGLLPCGADYELSGNKIIGGYSVGCGIAPYSATFEGRRIN